MKMKRTKTKDGKKETLEQMKYTKKESKKSRSRLVRKIMMKIKTERKDEEQE